MQGVGDLLVREDRGAAHAGHVLVAGQGDVPDHGDGAVAVLDPVVRVHGEVRDPPASGQGIGEHAGAGDRADVVADEYHGDLAGAGGLSGLARGEDRVVGLVVPDVVEGLGPEGAGPVHVVLLPVAVRVGVVVQEVRQLRRSGLAPEGEDRVRCRVLARLKAPPGSLVQVGLVVAVGVGPGAVAHGQLAVRRDHHLAAAGLDDRSGQGLSRIREHHQVLVQADLGDADIVQHHGGGA